MVAYKQVFAVVVGRDFVVLDVLGQVFAGVGSRPKYWTTGYYRLLPVGEVCLLHRADFWRQIAYHQYNNELGAARIHYWFRNRSGKVKPQVGKFLDLVSGRPRTQ